MKPEWIRIKGTAVKHREDVSRLLSDLSLNTVCHEAACPNIGECYGRKTATFMILGIHCTRGCKFCNVLDGTPESVDENEPKNVAEAVKRLSLRHVVVTSVTRDDLADGGASQFAKTIRAIRKLSPETTIEVLIPDFNMSKQALDEVIKAEPDVIAHNMETVKDCYEAARPDADYRQSLEVLSYIKRHSENILTKSGIMLGLGEDKSQVVELLLNLREVECDFLTIGQYLSPSAKHHPVVRYVNPYEFEDYKTIGYTMGFAYVASAPLVRSSYHADEALEVIKTAQEANKK